VRPRWVLPTVNMVLLVGSIPWVIGNSSRPLFGSRSVWRVPRTEQYFAEGPTLLRPYLEMARTMRDASGGDVGVAMGPDEWEYPMWPLLATPGRPLRIEHVLVSNASAREYERPAFAGFRPCAIVLVSPAHETEITVRDLDFALAWSGPGISVFLHPKRH
jgi:hypothetical protein